MPETLYLTILYAPLALTVIGLITLSLFKKSLKDQINQLSLILILSLEYGLGEILWMIWSHFEGNYYEIHGDWFPKDIGSFYYFLVTLIYLSMVGITLMLERNKKTHLFAIGYFMAAILGIIGFIGYSISGPDNVVYAYYQQTMSGIMMYLLIIAIWSAVSGRGKRINSKRFNYSVRSHAHNSY